MGAFKFRGGFNALAKLNDAQRRAGVVAYSSGNHAQAVALSARILQIPATIFMPHDAAPAKLAATQGYGAKVIGYDRYSEDASCPGYRLGQFSEWSDFHSLPLIILMFYPVKELPRWSCSKKWVSWMFCLFVWAAAGF